MPVGRFRSRADFTFGTICEANPLIGGICTYETGLNRGLLPTVESSEKIGRNPRFGETIRHLSIASETRERLMLAFNTPFFLEVLVASGVMAEGVDLHLNCR